MQDLLCYFHTLEKQNLLLIACSANEKTTIIFSTWKKIADKFSFSHHEVSLFIFWWIFAFSANISELSSCEGFQCLNVTRKQLEDLREEKLPPIGRKKFSPKIRPTQSGLWDEVASLSAYFSSRKKKKSGKLTKTLFLFRSLLTKLLPQFVCSWIFSLLTKINGNLQASWRNLDIVRNNIIGMST